MTTPFDGDAITRLGWRQGAVLGPLLTAQARLHAPGTVSVGESDWFIVTSHDCDVANPSLDKEPVVEVLRAVLIEQGKPDKQQTWGRNPRMLQIIIDVDGVRRVLGCTVHERWFVPREWLEGEQPARYLDNKNRRLIAEWLAKRYIRAAFPTEFDARWRFKLRDWQRLLERHSEWVQGVYLRLGTLEELPADSPYRCHFILAVPATKKGEPGWAPKRHELEAQVESFWGQFEPKVICEGVDVLATDQLTLADIEPYQRFDADWVSFTDDTAATPAVVDLSLCGRPIVIMSSSAAGPVAWCVGPHFRSRGNHG